MRRFYSSAKSLFEGLLNDYCTKFLNRIGRRYSLMLVRSNKTNISASVTLQEHISLKSHIGGPVFIGGLPEEKVGLYLLQITYIIKFQLFIKTFFVHTVSKPCAGF